METKRAHAARYGENEMVKQELALAEGAKIFKLQGPVLVAQEAGEAMANVDSRLAFLKREM